MFAAAEGWDHNVQEDFELDLFYNLDHVLKKAAGVEQVDVLAIMENPRFLFGGFDIVDLQGGVSALLTCGGFAKAFSNVELSKFGLITDHQRAFCDPASTAEELS